MEYFLKNVSENYCLNIIVNINSFGAWIITVDATSKYYCNQGLNKKLKIMEGAMKIFSNIFLGHEIFSSMVHWATIFFFFFFFFEEIVKPSGSSFYILIYTSFVPQFLKKFLIFQFRRVFLLKLQKLKIRTVQGDKAET